MTNDKLNILKYFFIGCCFIFLAVQASAVLAGVGQVGSECTLNSTDECVAGLECRACGSKGFCAPPGKEFICPFSTYTNFEDLLKSVTKYLFWLALAVCPLLIIVGAVYYMFSAGDPGKTKKGRDLIKWSLIGLAVMLLARLFFEVIKTIIVSP